MKKKGILLLVSLMCWFSSCEEKEIVDYQIIKGITTAYTPATRSFRDEILAQGQFIKGSEYKELGFYISEQPLSGDNIGTKYVATELTDSTFCKWIGDLKENTDYYIKAYGIEYSNHISYGTEVKVKTTDSKIDYITLGVVTDAAEECSARQEYVKGVVTDFGNDPEKIIEYGAYYWPVDNPSGKEKKVIKTDSPDDISLDVPFSVLISGLIPDTKYSYQVYARNNRKEQLTAIGTFVTGKAHMPTVETNAMKKIATTQAIASGTLTNNGNDPETEYGFYIGPSETNLSEKVIGTQNTEEDSNNKFLHHKHGLTKLTTYYICAYAKNIVGEVKGKVISFKTLDSSKPEIETTFYSYNEVTTTITENSVKVYANLISDGGETITASGAYWGTTSDNLSNTTTNGVIKENDRIEVEITGLKINQVIYYQIFAKNSLGETRASVVESICTQVVEPAWYNTGLASAKYGIPNHMITCSTTDYDKYYELPPITVTESDGKTYRYYFLDRNLGGTVYKDATTSNINSIGYQYIFSYPKPSGVPSTGVLAQVKYGWIDMSKSGGLQPAAQTNWNQKDYSPAPRNFSIPTRAEWQAFINWLPENQRNLTGVFNSIKLGVTGVRPPNGGVFQKSILICTVYAGECTNVTGSRPVFQARNSNSDTDCPNTPYIGIGHSSSSSYMPIGNVNICGGTAVRCMRKMEVIKAIK